MWYFSWILGTGLALAFGVLNAIWYEVMDRPSEPPAPIKPRED
jgi:cytochrome bd-I ubiquinol oxidase subunit X